MKAMHRLDDLGDSERLRKKVTREVAADWSTKGAGYTWDDDTWEIMEHTELTVEAMLEDLGRRRKQRRSQ